MKEIRMGMSVLEEVCNANASAGLLYNTQGGSQTKKKVNIKTYFMYSSIEKKLLLAKSSPKFIGKHVP